jgi:hypothetical protein
MNGKPQLVPGYPLAVIPLIALIVGLIAWQPAHAAPVDYLTGLRSPDPVLTIHDDGATNLDPGTVITFSRDGSARIWYQRGATHFFPAVTFGVSLRSLQEAVRRAGGPEHIRTGPCLKSSSFGRVVWLAVAGHLSGDLTCQAPNARRIDRRVADRALAIEQRVVRLSLAAGVK